MIHLACVRLHRMHASLTSSSSLFLPLPAWCCPFPQPSLLRAPRTLFALGLGTVEGDSASASHTLPSSHTPLPPFSCLGPTLTLLSPSCCFCSFPISAASPPPCYNPRLYDGIFSSEPLATPRLPLTQDHRPPRPPRHPRRFSHKSLPSFFPQILKRLLHLTQEREPTPNSPNSTFNIHRLAEQMEGVGGWVRGTDRGRASPSMFCSCLLLVCRIGLVSM